MRKAFVSCEVAQIIATHCSIEALPLSPFLPLDVPVRSHADMLVLIIGRKIFTYKDYYEQNKAVFDGVLGDGYELCLISKKCEKEYPNDIALNALLVGKTLFACLKNTAIEVLEYAQECGYKLVNVKQGYTACSTLVLDERSIIAADKSIYSASLNEGLDALLIDNGDITLDGYDYGFIGGASFVIDKTVYFLGDIKKHSNYNEIYKKINSKGMTISSILAGNVFDFGGIRLI